MRQIPEQLVTDAKSTAQQQLIQTLRTVVCCWGQMSPKGRPNGSEIISETPAVSQLTEQSQLKVYLRCSGAYDCITRSSSADRVNPVVRVLDA